MSDKPSTISDSTDPESPFFPAVQDALSQSKDFLASSKDPPSLIPQGAS